MDDATGTSTTQQSIAAEGEDAELEMVDLSLEEKKSADLAS
jgi:hypothetical protein